MTERMTFEDAWVDDPLLRGEVAQATFHVRVNIWPSETIAQEKFEGGWTVGKFGPFVKYTHELLTTDAGDFNIRFAQAPNRFPSIVDLTLHVGDEYTNEYSLYLKRSRVLLRKFSPNWRLILSDQEAQHGRNVWLPVEREAPCKFWEGEEICGATSAAIVRIDGYEVPYCAAHKELHNDTNAKLRREKTAS